MSTHFLLRPAGLYRPSTLLIGVGLSFLAGACTPDQPTAPSEPMVPPALLSSHEEPIEWEEQYFRVSVAPNVTDYLGGVRRALEPDWTRPLVEFPDEVVEGRLWRDNVDAECDEVEFPLPEQFDWIVLFSAAGECTMEEKVARAAALGAVAALVHNTPELALGGDPDAVIRMPGTGPVDLPAFFVGAETGERLRAAPNGLPLIVSVPYSYLRVTSSAFPGDRYRGLEALFTPPIADRTGQMLSGEVVHVGNACGNPGDLPDLEGKVALVERGGCLFAAKVARVQVMGAVGAVVYNIPPVADSLVRMTGESEVVIPGLGIVEIAIPAVFIARSPGLLIRDSEDTPVTITIDVPGSTLSERIDRLAGAIDGLLAQGSLNGGQATSLRSQLEAAKRQISRENLVAARNILGVLIQHIHGLVAQGTLSEAQAATLAGLVEAVLDSL